MYFQKIFGATFVHLKAWFLIWLNFCPPLSLISSGGQMVKCICPA